MSKSIIKHGGKYDEQNEGKLQKLNWIPLNWTMSYSHTIKHGETYNKEKEGKFTIFFEILTILKNVQFLKRMQLVRQFWSLDI